MKKIILSLLSFALFATVFTNCKDDDEIKGFGDLSIEFDHRAGDAALAFNTNYRTENGDTILFSTFNYYVSNFTLVKSDGTEYTVPKNECYFLVKHDDTESREITLKNIPAGDYEEIKFTIGVDSLKSVSDISERTGVLDPAGDAQGMYWAWNSGYIFVKIEGLSPQAPLNSSTNEHTVQYHAGLFGGKDTPTLNNLKEVELHSHDELAQIREGQEAPHAHVYVDILEVFKSPTTLKIADNPTSHGDAFSKTIAENYSDMFILDHVHNP